MKRQAAAKVSFLTIVLLVYYTLCDPDAIHLLMQPRTALSFLADAAYYGSSSSDDITMEILDRVPH